MFKKIRSQVKDAPADWSRDFALEVKRRLGEEASAATVERLKGLVLAFPDMAMHIRAWVEEPGHPAALRRLHEFVAAYIRNPDDILSDKAGGLFGYVDDAYLTARIYEATVLAPEWDRHPRLPPAGAYEKELPLWIAEIRRVMPREADRIDAMLSLVAEGARRTGLGRDALPGLD